MKITLDELREVLRAHPKFGQWDDGEDEALLLQLGPVRMRGLSSEARTRGDDRDMILLVDTGGRVQGIEFP